MVVTTRNLVHAALWLILTCSVSQSFCAAERRLLAVAQVVIYIGAIAILMIFAMMMTRRVVQDTGPASTATGPMLPCFRQLLFGGLAWMLSTWEGFSGGSRLARRSDPLQELGVALVSPNMYILPFELASVLLLAALIGALVIAWEKNA
jgi:NADH-quinone oxidoreductase subunit J